MASTIDYNSSGFSTCKSCGKSIPKGDIRYITDTVGTQGRRNLRFYHIECVLMSHRKKLLPLILESVLDDQDKNQLIEQLKKTGHIQILTKEELEKKELEEAIHDIYSKNNYKKARALLTLIHNEHILAKKLIINILIDLNELNLIKLAIYATGRLNFTEQVPRLLEMFRLDTSIWAKTFRDKSANLKDLMHDCSWVPVATEIKDDIIANLLIINPLPQEAIDIIINYYKINKNTSYIRNKLVFIEFFFTKNITLAEEELSAELMYHLKGDWVSSPLEWKFPQAYSYLKELLAIIKTYQPIGFQKVIENILTKPSTNFIPWKIFLELVRVALEYPTITVRTLLKNLDNNLKNLENYLSNSPVQSEIYYFNSFVKNEIHSSLQKHIDELKIFRSELANIK